MIDYYRAYTQRRNSSRPASSEPLQLVKGNPRAVSPTSVESALWLEDNLKADLKDEWERAVRVHDAQTLVTERSNVRLRAYDEPFFTHGKLHELADDGRVGWHPDFQARLEALLLGGTP